MQPGRTHLCAFWPISGTPYIFCDYRTNFSIQPSYLQTKFTNLIFDIRKGTREMRVDWRNFPAAQDTGRHSSRYTEQKGILVDGRHLTLIYEQIYRFDSRGFQRGIKQSAIYRKKKDLWKIDIYGEARKLDHAPKHFIQNQIAHRCLNFSRLAAVSSNRLLQYQLRGNDLELNGEWNEIGDSLMQLCSLPNHGFVFTNQRRKTIVFLQQKEPRIRSFGLQSVFADLPALPDEGGLQDSLSSLSWQLIPLSVGSKSPMLAYFLAPGFPIFEIHLDRLAAGSEKEVFRFLGFSPYCRPFVSLRQNQVLLFSNTLMRRSRDLSVDAPLFACEKRASGWPVEYGMLFQPQPISLPASIQRICEIPLDDEHLLGCSREAFWRIRCDGAAADPVFTRSGMFERP
ncbi:MAG: hypothetical protein JXR73_04455 [Candidatus Omnitrophica bacterium]|nr:hypothetical protein [Candidatus Omnitrophota bacterium]